MKKILALFLILTACGTDIAGKDGSNGASLRGPQGFTGGPGQQGDPGDQGKQGDTWLKAFADTTLGGTLNGGENLTVELSSTGKYTYTFITPMQNNTYAAVATSQLGTVVCYITAKTTAGFTVWTRLVSDQSLINQAHSVIVAGQ